MTKYSKTCRKFNALKYFFFKMKSKGVRILNIPEEKYLISQKNGIQSLYKLEEMFPKGSEI